MKKPFSIAAFIEACAGKQTAFKNPKAVLEDAIRNQSATSKWIGEPEDHARERLRAHWPGHNRDIDIALERLYHPERRG